MVLEKRLDRKCLVVQLGIGEGLCRTAARIGTPAAPEEPSSAASPAAKWVLWTL